MAKRIGKYKISNKETALSIADGGVVNGAITTANEPATHGAGAISTEIAPTTTIHEFMGDIITTI